MRGSHPQRNPPTLEAPTRGNAKNIQGEALWPGGAMADESAMDLEDLARRRRAGVIYMYVYTYVYIYIYISDWQSIRSLAPFKDRVAAPRKMVLLPVRP